MLFLEEPSVVFVRQMKHNVQGTMGRRIEEQ